MNLAEKISTERKRKGLSQDELADLAQVSLRTIQRIERQESIPRGFTLNAIAKALGKSLEELSEKEAEVTAVAVVPSSEEVVLGAPQETSLHPLQSLNISAFAFLLFPYLGFLLPLILWKRQNYTPDLKSIGSRIINFQIAWCIGLHIGLLLALLVQIICARYLKIRLELLVLGTFFFFYLLNIGLIFHAAVQLRKGNAHLFSRWNKLFL